MMTEYVVYRHTSPSGKVYIGITSQNPVKRWNGGRGYQHNAYFFRSILKYGWDKFTHEILYSGLSKEEACSKEIELIEFHNSTNPSKGYNISTGGDAGTLGIKMSPESRKKMSESHKGERGYNYGKHLSVETRAKLRAANLGKHHTDAARKKMSDARRGVNHPNYGKHLSQETRERISAANSGRAGNRVLCVETGVIYPSVKEAARKTGASAPSITSVCHKKPKYITAGGYHWEWAGLTE